MEATELPGTLGTYVVILACTRKSSVQIGKFGELQLRPGYYLYVGSAFGPGGLRARVSRHLRNSSSKKLRWHIDYLRAATQADSVWAHSGNEPLEHAWAAQLAELPGISIPMPGFGASDCNCTSHLLYSPTAVSRPAFTH